jgi:hypothetical protein
MMAIEQDKRLAIEEAGYTAVNCLLCSYVSYIHTEDNDGWLMKHPDRMWLCRVTQEMIANG